MEEKKVKVTILKEFRDKDDFSKVYSADKEFEFTHERAELLSKLGLVELEGTKLESVESINLESHWSKIVSDVNRCNDLEVLTQALGVEKEKADKARNAVVEALEARIKTLKPAE